MWISRQFLAGFLALTVAAGASVTLAAQGTPATKQERPAARKAPADQSGAQMLGTVTLTRAVLADGKPLPKGTYQVRLTGDEPKPAPGVPAGAEKWVEFVQRGQVKGREVATLVPQSDIKQVAKRGVPPNGAKLVQVLTKGEYIRVWIHKGDTHYLVNFPPESGQVKQ